MLLFSRVFPPPSTIFFFFFSIPLFLASQRRGCRTAFRTLASLPGTFPYSQYESKQFSLPEIEALGRCRCSRENVRRCERASEWVWLMRFVGLAWHPTSRLTSRSRILTLPTTTTTTTMTLSVSHAATSCVFGRMTELRLQPLRLDFPACARRMI